LSGHLHGVSIQALLHLCDGVHQYLVLATVPCFGCCKRGFQQLSIFVTHLPYGSVHDFIDRLYGVGSRHYGANFDGAMVRREYQCSCHHAGGGEAQPRGEIPKRRRLEDFVRYEGDSLGRFLIGQEPEGGGCEP
jgi:hypothetical protein